MPKTQQSEPEIKADADQPLPLVDFELYMLVDDAADFPMVIPVQLEFSGRLDPVALESALSKTIDKNRLLRSSIIKQGNKWCWIDAESPEIEWTSDFPDLVRLDLRSRAGLRILAKEVDGKTFIKLFIHHSVSDGSGIAYFIDSWLQHYAADRLNDGSLVTESAIEPDKLKRRGDFGMNVWKYLLRPIQEFCGLVGIMEYFLHRPVALGPQASSVPEQPSGDEELTHRHLSQKFSVTESKQILKNAKHLRYTVNDLMLAAMYEACHDWLVEKLPEEAHRHLRIMVPIDMRTRDQPERFVANKVSMIFLDRRPGRYKSLNGICWLVWLEMSWIKLARMGLTFLHLIGWYRFRNRLDKLLRRDRSIASTILSNMGPVFARSSLAGDDRRIHLPDATLESFQPYPPIRPYTWFTSVITTYGNEMSVHSTWCNQSLDQSDVERIQERFRVNLLERFEGLSPNG